LTNNLQWSARSVADLYRCRWQIEVFFKQIKQSLQLCDFLGNSANAVRWQVWTAWPNGAADAVRTISAGVLLYVLMRFLCVISRWNHSFTRLFTLLRAALWRKIDLWDLLRFCGTAGGHFRYLGTPQNAYLPGFAQ
jgi:Transposase DDE domain